MSTAPDRYAVMGNPIAHSKSPEIHALFASQTGQAMHYEAILVEHDRFPSAVREFVASGGRGLNVTVPFKPQACQVADRLSDGARRAGAVNTLSVTAGGMMVGDNTDGVGLLRDLRDNLHIELSDRQILLLGAGGAARGILEPLLACRPSRLMIANRTPQRAEQLAEQFSDLGVVTASTFEALAGLGFDLVINATSAGLGGEVPVLPDGVIAADTRCYDLMYASRPTAFMNYARARGARHTYDGLGMLVEQAAESFSLWRGVRPLTAPVIQQLRRQ